MNADVDRLSAEADQYVWNIWQQIKAVNVSQAVRDDLIAADARAALLGVARRIPTGRLAAWCEGTRQALDDLAALIAETADAP